MFKTENTHVIESLVDGCELTYRPMLALAVSNFNDLRELQLQRKATLLKELTNVEMVSTKLEADVEVLEQIAKEKPDEKDKLANKHIELKLSKAYEERLRRRCAAEEADAANLESMIDQVEQEMMDEAEQAIEKMIEAQKAHIKATINMIKEIVKLQRAMLKQTLNY